MSRILILGAGLSGLCAARELEKVGHKVVLVDKGRGIGGRMATRRFDGAVFDHGAQFFTARSDEFRTLLDDWQRSGVANQWFEGYPSPQNEKPDDHYPRFCGASGMTGIGKYLAQGLDVRLGEEIERLAFESGVWKAFSQSGVTFEGNELILTAPVPQSLALLKTAGIALPAATQKTLESLTYEPCFATLANLEVPSHIPPPGALFVNGDVIYWLADNFQKGISPRQGSVTIHSSGGWARAHYEDDQNQVGKMMLDAATPFLGAKAASFQVRRWRYSKPQNPLDIGSLRIEELHLSFAGDVFQGAKIEGAARSGLAAARAIS